MQPLRVLIIGGGVGGASLAHGLQRSGAPVDVKVFEREEHPHSGLHGYRVGISPQGAHALQQLLPEDLFKMFLHTSALPPKHFVMLDQHLDRLLAMNISSVPEDSVKKHDAQLPVDQEHSVSRMNLRQVLFTGLGDSLLLNKQFVRYELHDGGNCTVTAHFADGTSYDGDILIGADGSRSSVRKQLLPDEKVFETGIIALAAKFPLSVLSDKGKSNAPDLPEECQRAVTILVGKNGVGGSLHSMAFRDASQLDAAERDNFKDLLDRCEPSMQSWAHWALWGSEDKFQADIDQRKGKGVMDAAKDLIKQQGWSEGMLRLIELSDPSSAFSIRIKTSEPRKAGWEPSDHGVALLGDAVHTMAPGKGIGANTALKDALQLCNKLVALSSELKCDIDTPVVGPERRKLVKAAIGAYEEEMRGYAYPAVIASRSRMDARGWEHHYPLYSAILYWCMCTLLRLVDRSSGFKELMRRQMIKGRAREEASE
ncbi:FAD/NAD(P)-binding domain-containing protein [Tilletiaria anomala UBC 951]|uniref:FAD/NAD(P)-binding domain-containing protein n=1 Tax=Tilletiaria anomala (strain ATCC 24038 / CBS 436.72 / UBC 951) TaxID=1037660 RepID=A0A066VF16_TILAU|nr:FAD/NAD(P)-binding domain-containing protein [Tilletiaria anomala UBC 951]KDN38873.1 FAD/NAD(P)-binding domain-containing protein [Tilletiaria anomala UBC 951]